MHETSQAGSFEILRAKPWLLFTAPVAGLLSGGLNRLSLSVVPFLVAHAGHHTSALGAETQTELSPRAISAIYAAAVVVRALASYCGLALFLTALALCAIAIWPDLRISHLWRSGTIFNLQLCLCFVLGMLLVELPVFWSMQRYHWPRTIPHQFVFQAAGFLFYMIIAWWAAPKSIAWLRGTTYSAVEPAIRTQARKLSWITLFACAVVTFAVYELILRNHVGIHPWLSSMLEVAPYSVLFTGLSLLAARREAPAVLLDAPSG